MKSSLYKIEAHLGALEKHLPNQAVVNEAISKVSVGWHLEHSLLVMDAILDALIKSEPMDYAWKFNKIRLYIFARNSIPRGKGRAPEAVQPTRDFNPEAIDQLFVSIRAKLKEIDGLTKNHFFKHPIFGKLNLKRTLKFIPMHTQHHLDIMNDII